MLMQMLFPGKFLFETSFKESSASFILINDLIFCLSNRISFIRGYQKYRISKLFCYLIQLPKVQK